MFTNVKAMHELEQDLGMPGEKADNDPYSEEPLEATTPHLNILCEYAMFYRICTEKRTEKFEQMEIGTVM